MDIYETIAVQDAGYILVPFSEEELNFLYAILHEFHDNFVALQYRQRLENLMETLRNYGASNT